MGKAHKVKGELLDVTEMYNLIQTLKDIADNKLFTLLNQKEKFRRFGETFVEFFRMISLTKTKHVLIGNNNPKVGIVVITIEGSFLGEFNNKIIRAVLKEKDKHQQVEFIAVGNRSVDWLSKYTPNMKVFTNMESTGIYETALQVKDYIINEVMNGRLGKVMIAWSWPKTIDTQKPRVTKLLPCEDLVAKQSQFFSEFEHIIEESNPSEVIGYLCNLWVTTRLYEMLMDTNIASAAAQAAFLEESVDKMKKERVKTRMKYRKARKNDIDKSLRETFSARMISSKMAVVN
jgi:F-type H+-transporting ATPase subunit gamma